MMCTTDLQKALLKTGGGHARIFGPDGQQLHESLPEEQEGIIYADIDLGLVSLAKAAGDHAGHYSRPDVTQLVLNTHPRQPMLATAPTPQPGQQNARADQHAVAPSMPTAADLCCSPDEAGGVEAPEPQVR